MAINSTVKEKQRVLILYPTVTFFGGLLCIAEALQRSGKFDVIIYSHVRYPGWDDLVSRADAVGVKMLTFMATDKTIASDLDTMIDTLGFAPCLTRREAADIAAPPLAKHLRVGLVFKLWKFFLSKTELKSLKKQYTRTERVHRANIARANAVVDRLDIDLLVLATESVSHHSAFFLASMNEVQRRSVYMPLALPSHNELDGWMRNNPRGYGRVTTRADRIFAKVYPRWKRIIDGTPFIRVPAPQALALETGELAPRDPWTSSSMTSTVIAASGTFLAERLQELGARYRKDAIYVTGAAEDGDISEYHSTPKEIRAKLIADLELDPTKPILMLSAPSNVSNQYPLNGYDSFEELIAYWCNSLGQLRNVSAIVSPHPWYREKPEARDVLEGTGAKSDWRSAFELMPAVGLFCTYGASSTPRLAGAAGLPVLNYFAFKRTFSSEDDRSYFVGFNTMPVANSRAEWEQLLRKVDDAEWRDNLCARAKAEATYFGLARGIFGRRFPQVAEVLSNGRGSLADAEKRELSALCPADGYTAEELNWLQGLQGIRTNVAIGDPAM